MLKKGISVALVILLLFSMLSAVPTFAAAEEQAPNEVSAGISSNDISVTGVNSLGTMLAAEYEENQEDTASAGCGIYSVTIDSNTAHAEIDTLQDAKLIVAIFDEDGVTMHGCGMTDVTPDDALAELTLDVPVMPQYYLVRAFLLDAKTNAPLCGQYEGTEYTERMQDFLSKTADDFGADKVLNLDDSESENFLVYNDDTILINSEDESANIVTAADDNSKVYVIENIDDSIISLQEGDIFTYTYEESFLIVKVASVVIDGTTATITGENIQLQDVFDYIRIDTADTVGKMTVDESGMDEGVEYLGEEQYEDDNDHEPAPTGWTIVNEDLPFNHSVYYQLQKKFGDLSGAAQGGIDISGKVGLEMNMRLKCYYDIGWFTRDVDFSFTLQYKFSAAVKMEIFGKISIKLGELGFILAPGVYVSLSPSIILEGKLKLEFSFTINGQIGKGYNNNGFYDNSRNPEVTTDIKLEGTLFIGLSLEPRIKVLEWVVTASMTAQTGVKFTAVKADEKMPENNKKHICKNCIDGDVFWSTELSLKFSIIGFTWEIDVIKTDVKIGDFYISLDKGGAGFTTCPHYAYIQTVRILNENNKPFPDVLVNGSSTDADGRVSILVMPDDETVTLYVCGVTLQAPIEDSNRLDWTTGEISMWTYYIDSQNLSILAAKGKCGTNAKFTLYANGVLEITGTGTITNSREIRSLKEKTNQIVIRKGITEIGSQVFSDFKCLTNVIIPDSVTRIGLWSFDSCIALTSVSIPDSVTTIGEEAFCNCVALTSVTIPDSVTVIGDGAFMFCNKLADITIADSVVEIGESAFKDTAWLKAQPEGIVYAGKVAYQCKGSCPASVVLKSGTRGVADYAFEKCDSMTDLTIPDSVVRIGRYSFRKCSSLTKLVLPDGVEVLGNMAFSECTSLTSVTLSVCPDQLASEVFYRCSNISEVKLSSTVTRIGDYAFKGWINLKSIEIPDSVTEIGESAFDHCYYLDSVTLPDSIISIGNNAFSYCGSLKSINIPEHVESIGLKAFASCRLLNEFTIPDSVTHIGQGAFFNTGWYNSLPDGPIYAGKVFYTYKGSCPSEFTIKGGTHSIADSAFSYYTSLTHITFPNSLSYIGENAFCGCSALTDLYIPGSVRVIDRCAFEYCSGLTSITLSEGVTHIGVQAFDGCKKLTNVTIPNSVTQLDPTSFSNCDNLKSVTLGICCDNLISEVFYECPELSEVNLSNHVTEIGDHAFAYSKTLKTVTIPHSVTLIKGYAFYGCTALTDLSLPYSISEIGSYAFYGCKSLTEIEIPFFVNVVPSGAFGGCSGLTYVQMIDHRISEIGAGAFAGCSSLSDIKLPKGITAIEGALFRGCSSLTEITIPDGVTTIDYRAFCECTSLSQITIPSSVKSILEHAFYSDASLKHIYYTGSEEEWQSIKRFEPTGILQDVVMHYNYNSDFHPDSPDIYLVSKNTEYENGSSAAAGIAADELSRGHLVPGTEAVLLIVPESDETAVLSSSSFMYIAQGTADDKGNIRFDTPSDFSDHAVKVLIYGYCDHSSSAWKVEEEPSVEKNGLNVLICDHCGEILDTQVTEFIYDKYALGDADSDGEITILDATAIQRYLAGYTVKDADNIEQRADIDRKGVSILDATFIQRYLVELPVPFDIGKLIAK